MGFAENSFGALLTSDASFHCKIRHCKPQAPTGRSRAGDANKLLSVCKVLKDEPAAVSTELALLLRVTAVPVAVLHSRES